MPQPATPLIAHVIFRLDIGGLENGLVNLINAMPAERYRHAIVCIDRSTDFRDRIRRDDVEIVEIRKKPGRDPAATLRLYRALRRLRPDIVHTRNLGALDALLPAVVAGSRHRIHGEHGWDVSDVHGTSLKPRLLRKLHAPLISRYVAVSRDLKDYLVERVGVAESRITVICNGVDTEKFAPSGAGRRRRAELSPAFADETCVIGTVGRMDPVKGHTDLATAFIRLAESGPEYAHARLAIVGDGACRQDVTDLLQGAGLADRCWLPGRRDDIARILGSFDLFVQPSLAEGISNTVLEAMASGLPVIATDVGGNPELVLHGQTGVIVPARDHGAMAAAIGSYVRDRGLLAAHGAAARRRAVEEFSIDRMLQDYVDLYDAVLA